MSKAFLFFLALTYFSQVSTSTQTPKKKLNLNNKNLTSFCNQFSSSFDCAINDCQWINHKCYKISTRYVTKKIKKLSLSLPVNPKKKTNTTTFLENCDISSKLNSTDSIKCSWKVKPYSPDHFLAVNLTQNLNGEFIFGFHVKYYNGEKKTHLIYNENNSNSKPNFYDLGSNIQEIVFELISFDQVFTEMFNAEIIFNNKKNTSSFFTQDTFIVLILIGSIIFFLFFLAGLVGIFIRKCKERRSLQMQLYQKTFWKIAKQKEINLFFKKNLKPQKYQDISNKMYNDNNCPICLEDFIVDGKEVIQLNCKHLFHSKCILNWMLEKYLNPFCPICHDIICKNDYNTSSCIDVNTMNESLLEDNSTF